MTKNVIGPDPLLRVDQLLARSAERFPRKPAVVCGSERCSYLELEQRAQRLAGTLVDAGIEPGDRVAICLENSIDAVVAIFGVLKAGAVFFVVNPRTRPERLSELLADSGAAASVTQGLTISKNGPGDRPTEPDLAALVYTSGSTGEPKGVMLTHGNITAAAASICTYLENNADDVILSVLPLAFTYGLGQVTTAFQAGATLVLERSFAYPAAVLETMAREHVTGFPLVPTMATLLLQQDLSRHQLSHLRYITSAAAALSTTKIGQLREAFPGVRIYSMYGQTECQRVSYLPPEQLDAHPTSVGVAIPNSEAYVVDEAGEPVAPGVVGELVVRGPHVMQGYWNRAGATAKALRPGRRPGESVLYTGDLFRMDRDGFLYFVERKDDVIKTRGEKVAPRQIEEVIARLPGVAEAAVYGVPDELLGEAIVAVVTPSPGAALTAQMVQRHCLEQLEPLMVPKLVEVRDALPTTITGKVNRRELRAMGTAATEAAV